MNDNRWKMMMVMLIMMLITACTNTSKQSNNSERPPQEKIVTMATGVQEKGRHYPEVSDLLTDTGHIIYAELSGLRYELGDEGAIYTVGTWKVLENLKGDLDEGTSVEVSKDGGYATIQAWIDSFKDADMKEALKEEALTMISEEELKAYYTGNFSQGDMDSMVGDRSILFLKKGGSALFENAQSRLGGPEGEFAETEGGHFFKLGQLSVKDNRLVCEGATELPKGESLPTFYSLDEIKAMIAE
ncbi:MAG: hypothetical protein Q4D52_05920 [Eubacteriales bacterium]|nr:hypothetical protein [Eubacteriales bacterium]